MREESGQSLFPESGGIRVAINVHGEDEAGEVGDPASCGGSV